MTAFAKERNGDSAVPTLQKQLSPRELYVLRRAALEVERRRLSLQRAEQQLQGLLLRIELRYGLLGREAELDLRSGQIRRPVLSVAKEAKEAL